MRVLLALLLTSICLLSPTSAQGEEGSATPLSQADMEPSAYPTDRLRAEVLPLYQEEVTEIADLWLAHLRGAVGRVETLKLDGAATNDITAAEIERNAIAERLAIVVSNLEAKGGDGAAYRDYASATSGVSIDWFDPQGVAEYVSTWAVSPDGGIRLALNIVRFLVLLIVAWIIARVAAAVVRAAVNRLPNSSSLLREFAVKLTRRVVLLVGIVVAVGALGVNITPLIAAIGAAGLVIGLALQGTLSNFASGILILIYRPFDVGNVINAGGVAGKVEAMNLVSTRMLTFDNQVQHVPNNSIWNGVITNATGLETRRVDMVFGIGYSDDIGKAESIINDIIGSHPKVLAEPAPVIKVNELADNSVNFIARPWSKTADYWDVFWDVTRTVKERFDAEGVGIPYPQRDLHIPGEVRVVVGRD